MPYLTLTENLKLQLSALEALRNALYKCSTYLLTYLPWFSRFLRNPARKQSGSILGQTGGGGRQFSTAFSSEFCELNYTKFGEVIGQCQASDVFFLDFRYIDLFQNRSD